MEEAPCCTRTRPATAPIRTSSRRTSRRGTRAARDRRKPVISISSLMKVVLPLLGAVVVLLATSACARDRNVQAAEGQKPRAVKVEAAQVRDVRRQVDVIGTLAAREEVVVSAEVDGRVARLVHDLGDRVAAGEPLIELDSEKLRYRAEAQRAALEQARARYGVREGGELPPLDNVPTVVSTKAQLADAQQQLDRAKNLASRNLVSRSDLDEIGRA